MANFPGTPGNDSYQGGAADDVIEGGAGADVLRGGAGNDRLYDYSTSYYVSDTFVDQLYGEAGDDYLQLGAGDTGDGGDGNDTIYLAGAAASVIGGIGTDVLRTDYLVNISGTSISGIERLEVNETYLAATQLSQFAAIGGSGAAATTATLRLAQGGTGTIAFDTKLTNAAIYASTQTETLSLKAGTKTALTYYGGTSTGAGTITGGDGADWLEGGAGADVLRGGAGNDRLYDYSTSYNVSDTFVDQLYGEAGDDYLQLGAGDTGDGGDGNDTIYATGAATLLGGNGNDLLVGSTGNDRLTGGTGNDTASYERSSNVVTVDLTRTTAQNTGGGGTDTLSEIENLIGGGYNDTLTGDGGDNVLEGLGGNDRLNGAGGSDTASYSRAGAVTVDLRLTAAQNTLGAGTDTLVSIENLIGSAYADTLTGNGGANVIEGGAGTDLLDGQGGADTASYAGAAAAVTVSLALTAQQDTKGAGLDTLKNFENLRGSAFNDKLTGDAAANRLEGGAGNDTLTGGGGTDTLVGGDGNDTYVWDGADSIVEAATTAGGTDTVQSALSHTLSGGVEKLTLTGAAAVNGTGNSLNNTLTGNGAANVLSGLGGNDILNGGGGTDQLIGGDGDDTYVWDGIDAIVEVATTAGGIDTVQSALTHTLGTGVEKLTLTGAAAVNGTGNGLDNTLTGNGAANVLTGLAGNDILIGGAGADKLDGGTGADTFRFLLASDSDASAPDTIVFFDAPGAGAGDLIDLSAIDANTLTTGNGAFTFGSTATGGLSLVSQGSSTLIRGNTDADAAFEFAILITDGATSHTSYTAADFIL